MAIREGRWDCKHCGTRGIRGRETACPECGAARDADVEFYLPEEEPEVTDAALLTKARAGADWHCEHCGADNPASTPTCFRCGASRGGSESRGERFYAGDAGLPREAAAAEGINDTEDAAKEEAARRRAGAGIPGFERFGYYQSPAEQLLRIASAALAVAAAFWAIWFFFFSTRPVSYTVAAVRWERSIAVEHYVTVAEEGWSVPNGGRVFEQYRKIHHHDQVLVGHDNRTREVSEQVQTGTRTVREKVGTRDKGNGFFEDVYRDRQEPIYTTRYRTEHYTVPIYKDVPVYQTSYRYRIERWKPAGQARRQGADHKPVWPDLKLKRNERQGERAATYQVVLSGPKGERLERKLSEAAWRQCPMGRRITGHVNRVGRLLRLDLPE